MTSRERNKHQNVVSSSSSSRRRASGEHHHDTRVQRSSPHMSLVKKLAVLSPRQQRKLVVSSDSNSNVPVLPASLKANDDGGGAEKNKKQKRTKKKKLQSSLRRLVPFRAGSRDKIPAEIAFCVVVVPGMSAVQWLAEGCPPDVVSHILAFSGPQTVARLARVNQHWNQIIRERDDMWRVLCEELYKWKPGDDIPAVSWKDYYWQNPCVPVDYRSISAAIRATLRHLDSQQQPESTRRRNVRVLVRPGRYEISKPIRLAKTDTKDEIYITIQKMPLPVQLSAAYRLQQAAAAEDNSDTTIWDEYTTLDDQVVLESSREYISRQYNHHNDNNQPLFHMNRGHWTLQQIRLHHDSPGTDIWRGNAAIHVDNHHNNGDNNNNNNDNNNNNNKTSVVLEQCEVTSTSGRGIVLLEGTGEMTLQDCIVHNCAATGIYVGGNARLGLQQTDVITNGMGNSRRGSSDHRGIARGHSGIYLEEGRVQLRNSTVARNAASGIGVTSANELDHLILQHADIVSNGYMPVEVREDDLATTRFTEEHHDSDGNRLLIHGTPVSRSSLLSSSRDKKNHHRSDDGLELSGPNRTEDQIAFEEFEEYIGP